MFNKLFLKYTLIIFFLISGNVYSDRIRDLISIQGVRYNQLIGYGLVVGLDGTGDQINQIPYTIHTLKNMLSQLGIEFSQDNNTKLKNIASVMVTAKYSNFVHPGQQIDVIVSSIGNAKSLKGGTLLMTPLRGIDNKIYAIAQGNILIEEKNDLENKIKEDQINHLNNGKIINGATIERETNSIFSNNTIVVLQLNKDDFTIAQKISEKINSMYPNTAIAINSRTVRLNLPQNNTMQVKMLSNIQNINVNIPIQDAKVIINTKTGNIVMNNEVRIDSCAISHENLSIIIDEMKEKEYLDIPYIPNNEDNQLKINQKDNIQQKPQQNIHYLNKSIHLNNIVRALNSLGVQPIELSSILQAMHDAGCLHAKLEIR